MMASLAMPFFEAEKPRSLRLSTSVSSNFAAGGVIAIVPYLLCGVLLLGILPSLGNKFIAFDFS